MKSSLLISLLTFTKILAFDLNELELPIETEQEIKLDSGPLIYKATTGMYPVFIDEEKVGELFFIAYIKENETNRPLTFVFPGGPGGACTNYSIRTLGPRRLQMPEEGRNFTPPYKIVDNQETLLEYSDLIFVDPISSGYSTLNNEDYSNKFFSVEGDIISLTDFIEDFLGYYQRWNSPIYLAGFSYGTIRCVGISNRLLQKAIPIKGMILGGCAFNFATLDSERDKSLADCLLIPTLAATAWYHGRLMPEETLEDTVDLARRFAFEAYAPFQFQPNKFSPFEKSLFEKDLSHITGLSLDVIRRYDGRINEKIFTTEFFAKERKKLGGLDSRYSTDIITIDPQNNPDPSYKDKVGTYAAFQFYLQEELKTSYPFKKYISFSNFAFSEWNYNTFDANGPEINFLQRIRYTLSFNPEIKIFIGSGYYDCRTPFAATEYCFEKLNLPSDYKKNLQFAYYEAGHGFILDLPSLKKFKEDLKELYMDNLSLE